MPATSWSSIDLLNPKKTGVGEVPNFFGRTPEARSTITEANFPKVPGADSYLEQAFRNLDPLGANLKADTGLFRSEVGRTQPELGGYLGQEVADISRLFTPGGYEQQFADIRGRRAKAFSGLSDAILGDLRKVLNLNARGGAGGTGLSSYLMSTAANQAARTRADEAVDASTAERADLATLMAGRGAAAGKRQTLTDALLQRLMMPAEKEAAASNVWTQQLQQALNAAIANLVQSWGLSANAEGAY